MQTRISPTISSAAPKPTTHTPPDMPRVAAQDVFGIAELLEEILIYVPPLELFRLQEVNKGFNNTISGSRALQKLRLDAALKPRPVTKTRRSWLLERCVRHNLLRANSPYTSKEISQAIQPTFSPFDKRLGLSRLRLYPFIFDKIVDDGEERSNGDEKQSDGDERVPEVRFTYFREERPSPVDGPAECKRPKLLATDLPSRVIGYKGKRKIHLPDQSWSRVEMKTNRPFDISVCVVEAEATHTYTVRFGPERRCLRDFFEFLIAIRARYGETSE